MRAVITHRKHQELHSALVLRQLVLGRRAARTPHLEMLLVAAVPSPGLEGCPHAPLAKQVLCVGQLLLAGDAGLGCRAPPLQRSPEDLGLHSQIMQVPFKRKNSLTSFTTIISALAGSCCIIIPSSKS